MKEQFWNEEVQKAVERLSRKRLIELLLNVWDTATFIYVDETDAQRIKCIEDTINTAIGIDG
ncbi:hypothetical protein [Clostridium sp. UBA871]|uniref:hypothetical protein n=1 Tax=Clostridium sp. UBA871 TaxID=1946380 RepID=UPI0032162E38